jgi:pseudoazurin
MEMLNKGSESATTLASALVRMAAGDSVHFIATDKGLKIDSIGGLIPQNAKSTNRKMSESMVVSFYKPGVYGIRCTPHYGMGMIAQVVVGASTKEDIVKTINHPSQVKDRLTKLFFHLDAQKSGR